MKNLEIFTVKLNLTKVQRLLVQSLPDILTYIKSLRCIVVIFMSFVSKVTF